MFSVNARGIMNKLKQKPPIEIYMKLNCTEEELNTAAAKIKAMPKAAFSTVPRLSLQPIPIS